LHDAAQGETATPLHADSPAPTSAPGLRPGVNTGGASASEHELQPRPDVNTGGASALEHELQPADATHAPTPSRVLEPDMSATRRNNGGSGPSGTESPRDPVLLPDLMRHLHHL
jgi:hypothetical protein